MNRNLPHRRQCGSSLVLALVLSVFSLLCLRTVSEALLRSVDRALLHKLAAQNLAAAEANLVQKLTAAAAEPYPQALTIPPAARTLDSSGAPLIAYQDTSPNPGSWTLSYLLAIKAARPGEHRHPYWRNLVEQALVVSCPGSGAASWSTNNCRYSSLQIGRSTVLAGNAAVAGDLILDSQQAEGLRLVVLGGLQVGGRVVVQGATPGLIEIVAAGDVEIGLTVSSSAELPASLLIYSAGGAVALPAETLEHLAFWLCQEPALPPFRLRLEGRSGVRVQNSAALLRRGCELERHPAIWPGYAIIGERLIPDQEH